MSRGDTAAPQGYATFVGKVVESQGIGRNWRELADSDEKIRKKTSHQKYRTNMPTKGLPRKVCRKGFRRIRQLRKGGKIRQVMQAFVTHGPGSSKQASGIQDLGRWDRASRNDKIGSFVNRVFGE